MKSFQIALAILTGLICVDALIGREKLIREPPPPKQRSFKAVETKWMSMRLDHFDAVNPRMFDMRYFENNEHFMPGGPIFIYVGGEWEITASWLQGGHMYDMAEQMNGTMYYTEHRFYGKSWPTEDSSVENLRFLSVDQALADLADFIREIKRTVSGTQNSGVILVGGSYSATMVSWFRQRYPDLANGAWASSAPLLAKVDFIEYKEIVGESIKLVGGEACYNRFESAFKIMETMIADNQSLELSSMFRLCKEIWQNDDLSVWQFFSSLTDDLAGVVQYHRPGNIENVCNKVMNGTDDLEGVANYFNEVYANDVCLNIDFDGFTEYYKNSTWTHPANTGNGRQWTYQTCSEFGWYQTSGSEAQPFGSNFPVELSLQMCRYIFGNFFSGSTIQENAARTNRIQNGMNPKVTNVYFTHGQLDPWRAMGIQSDLNSESPATVIPLHSHCADLYSINTADTPEMRASKLRVTDLVKKWLTKV